MLEQTLAGVDAAPLLPLHISSNVLRICYLNEDSPITCLALSPTRQPLLVRRASAINHSHLVLTTHLSAWAYVAGLPSTATAHCCGRYIIDNDKQPPATTCLPAYLLYSDSSFRSRRVANRYQIVASSLSSAFPTSYSTTPPFRFHRALLQRDAIAASAGEVDHLALPQ